MFLLTACTISRTGLGGVDSGGERDGGQHDTSVVDAPPDANDASMDAGPAPVLESVDYEVVAHGARLEIRGANLETVGHVELAGMVHVPSLVEPSRLVISEVHDATPAGPGDLVAFAPSVRSNSLPMTVVHLLVSELDQQTDPGTDRRQFVEIATGVPGANLEGHVLVLYGADGLAYYTRELSVTSDAEGTVLLGTDTLTPSPSLTWPAAVVLDGPGAVVIHQGRPESFPPGTAVTATALIDALVFHRMAEPEGVVLLDTLLGAGPERVQVNENASGTELADSIQRCSSERLDGRAFEVAGATPGATNSCMPTGS